MINLLCVIPNASDATSFYRAIGPLSALRKTNPELSLNFVQEVNWSTSFLCDAMFIQRPFTPRHLQQMQVAKDAGLKIWVDYDDDLFQVPNDNPTKWVYGDPNTQKNIAKMIAMSDEVTVSTETLRKALVPLNKSITVVPNAYDERLGNKSKMLEPRNKIVNWRGSNTHQKDLTTVAVDVWKLAAEFPEWAWNFMGYNPWFITEKIADGKAFAMEALPMMEYFSALNELRPAVQIVPLFDSPFNRAKSNIAWIEATAAGAVTIAPNFEEWERPGVLTYSQSDAYVFKEVMLGALKGSYDLKKKVFDSWSYIQDTLRLSIVNRKREAVLTRLI